MAQWKHGRTRSSGEHDFTYDEKIASIFQPDTLVSAQYFGNLRRNTVLEPEQKLMFAILEDAIDCYRTNVLTHNGKGKTLFYETESWIVESGSDWIFSFDSVCEALGFNPEYIREGLFRWKDNSRQRQSREPATENKRAAG
jgi:hypothetical protein